MRPRTITHEQDKERKINYIREYMRKRRAAALAILGNRCVACGFDDFRALQIDHILGGGTRERREAKTGVLYWNVVIQSVLKGEKKYQILCANCNWIKRSENKETPGRPKLK